MLQAYYTNKALIMKLLFAVNGQGLGEVNDIYGAPIMKESRWPLFDCIDGVVVNVTHCHIWSCRFDSRTNKRFLWICVHEHEWLSWSGCFYYIYLQKEYISIYVYPLSRPQATSPA